MLSRLVEAAGNTTSLRFRNDFWTTYWTFGSHTAATLTTLFTCLWMTNQTTFFGMTTPECLAWFKSRPEIHVELDNRRFETVGTWLEDSKVLERAGLALEAVALHTVAGVCDEYAATIPLSFASLRHLNSRRTDASVVVRDIVLRETNARAWDLKVSTDGSGEPTTC